MTDLDEIKRVPLNEIAEHIGFSEVSRTRRGEIKMVNDEDEMIIVNQRPDTGHYVFFAVEGGASGTIVDFFEWKIFDKNGNISFIEKIKNIKDVLKSLELGLPTNLVPKINKNEMEDVRKTLLNLNTITQPNGYLLSRGISFETQLEFGIKKRMNNALVFEMFRFEKGWKRALEVGYQCINADTKINTGYKSIWGKIVGDDVNKGIGTLIICESPIDCMSYHQLYNATATYIATMGEPAKLGLSSLEALALNANKVIIATDRDEKGHEYANKIEEICQNIGVKSVRETPINKDFNEDLLAIIANQQRQLLQINK